MVKGKDNGTPQPDYLVTKPIYSLEQVRSKVCTTDADCSSLDTPNGSAKGACLQHMWKYNGQNESAKGCWDLALCKN